MDKHEIVVTLSAGAKNRMDRAIRLGEYNLEKDILLNLLENDGITEETYINELKCLYSALTCGRTL